MNTLFNFDIIHGNETRQTFKSIVIISPLDDSIQVKTDCNYLLEEQEILILNVDTEYRVEARNEAKVLVMHLSSDHIRKLFKKKYQFEGYSHIEIERKYSKLHNDMSKLIRIYYSTSPYREVELHKAYYEFLLFFVDQFGIEQNNENDIASLFRDYVEETYEENISLVEASEHFSMTSQYFSKLFKEKMGKNYHSYVRSLQLEHALNDVINSEKNILHIALDNGFPNPKAFTDMFVETYGESVSEYRKRFKHDEVNKSLFEKLSANEEDKNQHVLSIDVSHPQSYKKYWNNILNFEHYEDFNDANVQSQLLNLQDQMHFSFVRIFLDATHYLESESYSFYFEEKIFNALIRADFSFWLVIDIRNKELVENIEGYLKGLLSHFANKIGIHNIHKWRFELMYDTFFDEVKKNTYEDIYKRIETILGQFGLEDVIIGPSILLDYNESVVPFMKHNKYVKNFSFWDAPIHFSNTENIGHVIKDIGFLKNDITQLKNSRDYKEQPFPIYITYWADSMMTYNIMNDSCYKGALIIKVIIDLFNEVETLACIAPLDLLEKEALGNQELFGGKGLVTKNSLYKPSYYAYNFLARLADEYITKDDHSLITTNRENYQIICHNCKDLSYKYYFEEENISFENIDEYFEDSEKLHLRYHFENVKNGSYMIKRRYINHHNGSIQDNYYELVGENNVALSFSELNYLERISTPKEQISVVEVTDHKLDLEVTLEKNEFDYIHIIYQY